MSTLWQSIAGLPDFLLYFVVALLLLAAFVAIYVRVTPYREFVLIRGGNIAAAISLTGALIGFVLPLASAIARVLDDPAGYGERGRARAQAEFSVARMADRTLAVYEAAGTRQRRPLRVFS